MTQNAPKSENGGIETVEAPGVAEVILWDRIAHAATERRDAAKARCLSTLAMFFVEEARRTDKPPKTYRAEDGEAACNVQMRSKGKRGLTPEAVDRLGKAKVPLRTTGHTLGLNAGHLADQSVLKAIKKLAQNPKNGLPSDLVVDEEPVITADDSAVIRVLRMDPKVAVSLLTDVADLSLQKPMIDWSTAAQMLQDNPGSTAEDPDILDAIIRSFGGAAAPKSSAAPVPVTTAPEPKVVRGRGKTAEVVPLPTAPRGRRRSG